MEKLYHIHRKDSEDTIWKLDSRITIDNSFQSRFYQKLLIEDSILRERYGDYDIDYFIAIMEEMKFKGYVSPDELPAFEKLLKRYYFLRREQALEEGRKIYSPLSPPRMNSVYLSMAEDVPYWVDVVGEGAYDIFEVSTDGNLFISSDSFFPDQNLMFDIQVEKSKEYWKPNIKELTLRKEILFQGILTITGKR